MIICRFDIARILSPMLTATIALLLSSSVPAAVINVINNGSFEQNNFFIERSGFPRVDDLNGSTPTGWTRDSGDVAEYMKRSPSYLGVTVYNPADGDYFIGFHDGEWWQQVFATIPGATYQLTYSSAYGAAWWADRSFYYRPGGLSSGTVSLTGTGTLFSGSLVGTVPAPSGSTLLDSPFVWSEFTATFVADSNFTTLRFEGPSALFGGFIFVDNVAVTTATAAITVPEPGPSSLLLVGACAFWFSRKRNHAFRHEFH